MNQSLGATAPLELPRLVMRRAAWVALAALLTALLLGLWSSSADIDDETRSAVALAATLARAIDAAQRDEPQARSAVALLQRAGELRHVTLTLRDADARVLFDSAAQAGADNNVPWLAWLDRWGRDSAPVPAQEIVLKRPDGSTWALQVAAARGSERREALGGLAQMLLLVAAGSGAILAVMAWNMRRAFAPLRTLVQVIEQLRAGAAPDAGRLAASMPIRELQTIAQAVHGLQRALEAEATRRRVLSQQVLTLQEDERQRLSRELHDEFGQHLTALRVDAAWLAQRLAQAPEQARVAEGVAARCGQMQQQIRGVLTRLHPLSQLAGDDTAAHEPAARLAELLHDLVDGWRRSATQTCAFELRLSSRAAGGPEAPWPRQGPTPLLPRDLVLTLYRMSQEALTNVARHAQATQAQLGLVLHLDAAHAARAVEWQLSDDGVGLAEPERAQQRGTGLAALKERAGVLGAELRIAPTHPGQQRPGLCLAARFDLIAAPR